MKKILVICGATASGKTKLSVDCALKLNSEVISADSQLIYKELNIGTAKPLKEEMRGVKHHMIDIVEPTDRFSVSDYEKSALPIVEKLISESKIPVICGGTGFYINSLLFDLSYGKTAADEEVRLKYTLFFEKYGKQALYEKLREVDPVTAEKLHPNDIKRLIRALEIYELSGKRKSEQNDGFLPRFDYTAVAIDYPRDELYDRINKRVDNMFDDGLINEVKGLLSRGIDENYQCMQAIGYKEVVSGLKNGDLQSTMSDIIKLNTRHYAKRQLTFFKKLPNLVWLKPEEATADRIEEMLNRDGIN
ncbi:MAG: tRNA (adenosine(37)-N6)-dimethylallyltransferase MiaA [Clostridia bacterium]|nr:tRNA (adenosine(37)-N6)-dimethylallyltransferase MiaA [Clostridia bacterium]